MKAILVNDDRSLRWDNVSDPVIKEDEVLVEIHAAALNRADLMQRETIRHHRDVPNGWDLKLPELLQKWVMWQRKRQSGKSVIKFVRFSVEGDMQNMWL